MIMDDNDGQMIFGDLGSLNLPDIYLTGKEKSRKNLTQETCPDRGSNPGPLRDSRACYRRTNNGGLLSWNDKVKINMENNRTTKIKPIRTSFIATGGPRDP